jgi:PEP-CTERM motif
MKQCHGYFKPPGPLVATAIALAFAAGFAQAGPIVTQWGYSTNATFSAPTFTAGGGAPANTPSELSWGVSGGNFQVDTGNPSTNRSALTVGNFAAGTLVGGGPATGSVTTDANGVLVAGEIGKGISFTHWNNPLDGAFSTLTGATITDTLTLTPQVPAAGPATNGPTLTFVFKFRETPNAGGDGGAGLCADGSTAGSHPGGCPDLFGFTNTSVINNSFIYDGNNYFASVLTLKADGTLDTVGIGALTSGECGILGLDGDPIAAGNQCLGFRTNEAANTTERFGLAVSLVTLSVPEPGSLAMLGLGLAGLGLARRRKALRGI